MEEFRHDFESKICGSLLKIILCGVPVTMVA